VCLSVADVLITHACACTGRTWPPPVPTCLGGGAVPKGAMPGLGRGAWQAANQPGGFLEHGWDGRGSAIFADITAEIAQE
jgi:hypothetical protein